MIDRLEPPVALLPAGARLLGAEAAEAHRQLQRVDQLEVPELSRRAQPGKEIGGRAERDAVRSGHAPQQAGQRTPHGAVAERATDRHRERDRGRREDLGEQPRRKLRSPHDHGDLVGRHAALEQLGDTLGDQLELGPLAPALQQLHHVRGIHAPRRRLEQRTLEVRERAATALA